MSTFLPLLAIGVFMFIMIRLAMNATKDMDLAFRAYHMNKQRQVDTMRKLEKALTQFDADLKNIARH